MPLSNADEHEHDMAEVALSLAQEVRFYRRALIGAFTLLIIVTLVASGVTMSATHMATDLLVYENRCVTPEVANHIITISEAMASVNGVCLSQHKRDLEYVQAVINRERSICEAAKNSDLTVVREATIYDHEDVPTLP